ERLFGLSEGKGGSQQQKQQSCQRKPGPADRDHHGRLSFTGPFTDGWGSSWRGRERNTVRLAFRHFARKRERSESAKEAKARKGTERNSLGKPGSEPSLR